MSLTSFDVFPVIKLVKTLPVPDGRNVTKLQGPALTMEGNMTQKEIEKKIVTAVNIAIGDGGFRSKEVLEIFQQLAKMTPEKYKEQVKNFG